jgi:hypothetical protein
MSYDLWTWDSAKHPAPTATFADVTKTFLDLQEVIDGPNPKFVEFARQLVARYPSSDMFKLGDPDALDSVWAGNPVIQAQTEEQALFGISLYGENRLAVMRHFVEAANTVGLTVFDDQLGMAFLPNGQVLPPEAQAQWAAVKQELASQSAPISKAQMRKIAISQVQAMAQKHGFVKRKKEGIDTEFVRPIEGGEQIIWVQIYGTAPHLKLSLSFSIEFEKIEHIYHAACPSFGGGGGGGGNFFFLSTPLLAPLRW